MYHIARAFLDDLLLIKKFQDGDSSVFGEIVLKYQDRIYNLCRHMLGNPTDAEDAAQDAFLKAYQALPKFQPDASLYTWLYRIATNTCIDYRRKPVFDSLFKSSENGEELVHDPASDAPSPGHPDERAEVEKNIKTFDELDFVVFSTREWTRAWQAHTRM